MAGNCWWEDYSTTHPVNNFLSLKLNQCKKITFIREFPEQGLKNATISGFISSNELKQILSEDKSFSDQLSEFVSSIKITQHDISAKFEMVNKILQSVFRASFPRCVTYRFGSTVTGLGFKNCDLDVFLDIGK